MKRLFFLLITSFFAFLNLCAQIPTDGLLFYYPLNGDLSDASGKGENGTSTVLTFGTDRFGNTNSAYFNDDGNNSGIVNPTQYSNPQDFSISYWFKTDHSGTKIAPDEYTVMSCFCDNTEGTSFNHDRKIVMSPNASVTANIYNGGSGIWIMSSNAYDDNTWHHVVMNLSSSDGFEFYMDGNLVDSIPAPVSAQNKNGYWRFGGWLVDVRNAYYGMLDDIRVYNRDLLESEVQALYEEGGWSSLNQGLIAYYPFNGNANDESGNGYDGTVDGATLSTDRFGSENSSYHFSGADQITTNFSGITGTADRTISFWVKVNNDEKGGYILSYGSGYGEGFSPAVLYDAETHPQNPSHALLDISDAYVLYNAKNTNDGNWHNYVYIFSTDIGTSLDGVKIYQDGTLLIDKIDDRNYTKYILNTGTIFPFQLGGNNWYENSFTLDDVKVYNRILSINEIQKLYQNESQKVITSEVIWQNDIATGTYDLTGNVIISDNGVLTIEPGTIVRATGNYGIFIEGRGRLIAAGTEQDSIIFDADYDKDGIYGEDGEVWHGIRFGDSNPMDTISYDCSNIEYCRISHGKNQYGGGLYLKNVKCVFINHCNISGNYAEPIDTIVLEAFGGGMYSDSSDVNIQNTIIKNNTVLDVNPVIGDHLAFGGGLYVNSCKVKMENCTVNLNKIDVTNYAVRAKNNYVKGGGIYANGSSWDLKNIYISNNEIIFNAILESAHPYYISGAKINSLGGGMYLESCEGQFYSANITNNFVHTSSASFGADIESVFSAARNSKGGGLYIDNSNLNFFETLISKNNLNASPGYSGSESVHGGAIYTTNSTLNLFKVDILNNFSSSNISHGGGVYSDNSKIKIEKNCIEGNIINQGLGGGIYLINNSVVDILSSQINNNYISNEQSGQGGGIYCSASKLKLYESTVDENLLNIGLYARDVKGGGICLLNNSTCELFNTSISANSVTIIGGYSRGKGVYEYDYAKVRGGGVYCEKSNLQVINSTIAFNSLTKKLSNNYYLITEAYGGGIYHDGNLRIINSTIAKNIIDLTHQGDFLGVLGYSGLNIHGSGFYSEGDSVEAVNTVFWNNYGKKTQTYFNSSSYVDSEIEVIDCLTEKPFNYCAIQDTILSSSLGIGNIRLDSLNFGNTDSLYYPVFTDPDNGDFRLKSISDLINRGTLTGAENGFPYLSNNGQYILHLSESLTDTLPDTCMNGNSRYQQNRIDIGAYEGYASNLDLPTYSEYIFEESEGITVFDSNDSIDGIIMDTISRVDGVRGSGLEFEGSGYISLGESFSENVKDELTLSAWLKPSTTGNNYLGVIMHGGPAIDTYGLYIRPDTKEVGFKTSGTTNAWVTLADIFKLWDGGWHLLTVTYDGSQKVVFFDKDPILTVEATGQITSGIGYNLLIGAGRDEETPTQLYQGQMDEVRIYNYSLANEDIVDLYNLVPLPTYSEYLFEESEGVTVIDSHDSNDGTIVNTASRVEGVRGEGLDFTGSGYVSLGKSFSTNVAEQVSLSAWIKPSTNGTEYQGIIMHGGPAIDTYGLYVKPDTKEIGFKTSGTTSAWLTLANVNELWDGYWHLLTVTYDGLYKVVYLDKDPILTVDATGQITSGEGYNLLIGAGRDEETPSLLYQGLMDETRIYNYALKKDDVVDLYNLVSKPTYSEYLFEELDGATVFDSQDSNDGTILNKASRVEGVRGGGLEFTGSGYVSLGQSFSTNVRDEVTLSAWIKPSTIGTDYQGVIMHGGPEIDTYALYVKPDTKEIGFKTSGTSSEWMYVASVNELWDGYWHLITVTYNGSHKVVYLDKESILTVEATGQITSGDGYNLFIGAGREEESLPHLYQGLLDEVRIYNYAIAENDVVDLYNLVSKPTYSEYLFEESDGVIVIDSHDSNDGIIMDTVSRVDGVRGSGLEFSGSGYIGLGNNFSTNVSDQVTLSAWIKPSTIGTEYQGIIMHGGPAIDTYALYVRPDTKEIGFKTSGTSTEWMYLANVNILWDGNWHLLTVTYDGSHKVVYLDKEPILTVEATGQITSGDGYNLFIGTGREEKSLPHLYHGLMDEARIYNYALTNNDVVNLYNLAEPYHYSFEAIAMTTGGSATVDKSLAYNGETVTFTVNSEVGYSIDSVIYNNDNITVDLVSNQYEITALEAGVLKAYFSINQYSFTASAMTVGGNTSVDKSIADYGETVTFTTTPEVGYSIDMVIYNGENVTGDLISGEYSVIANESGLLQTYFSNNQYNFIANAMTTGGSASVDKSVADYGEIVTFTITPEIGYSLDSVLYNGDNITGDLVSDEYVVTVSESGILQAYFSIDQFNFTASSMTVGGSASVDKLIADYGETVTFTIIPEVGYSIDSVIYNDDNVTGFLNANKYSLTATEPGSLQAYFSIKQFSFTASAVTIGGSVSIDKSVADYGETVTFAVAPDVGYSIDSVIYNGDNVTGDLVSNEYIVTATEPGTLQAYFSINQYSFTATSMTIGGSAGVDKSVAAYGETVTFTITPEVGYSIDMVIYNGENVTVDLASNKYIITATGPGTLQAYFSVNQYSFTATAMTIGGSAGVDKSVAAYEETISFTVTPDVGYSIDSVKYNGDNVTGMLVANEYSITAIEPGTLQAYFSINQFSFVTSVMTIGGSASVDKSLADHGETVTFTVTPEVGYSIDSVVYNGDNVTGDLVSSLYVITAIEAGVLQAYFSINQFSFTASAMTVGGSASVDKSIAEYGETVTFTLTPEIGYSIDMVIFNGDNVTGDLISGEYSVSANESGILQAYFSNNQYNFIANVMTAGGSASVDKSLADYGEIITFTITPDIGYSLDSVLYNSSNVTNNLLTTEYTVTAIESGNLQAYFSINQFSFTSLSMTVGGSANVDKSVAHYGETVTFKMIPEVGYSIDSVIYNDDNVTGDLVSNEYIVSATEPGTLKAYFSINQFSFTASTMTLGGSANVNKSIADYGETVTFTVTPEVGYSIDSVIYNGEDVTGDLVSNLYVITAVEAGALQAYFSINQYSFTATAMTTGGSVSVDKSVAAFGETVTFIITPEVGYIIDMVLYNGENITVDLASNQYIITATGHGTLQAYFSDNQYSFTTSAMTTGGTTSVNKSTANLGETVTFTITPEIGYSIDSVIYTGDNVTGMLVANTYNITATESGTLLAYFSLNQFSFAASAITIGGNASVDKSVADYGEIVTFTVTPAVGYSMDSIVYNGEDVTGDLVSSQYMITAIEAGVLLAYFSPNQFSFTAAAMTVGGSASVDKSVAGYGDTVTYIVKPDEGYLIHSVIYNGENATDDIADSLYIVIAFEAGNLYAYFNEDVNSNQNNVISDIIQIFPNPNEGQFTITWQNNYESGLLFKVYDMKGQLIDIKKTKSELKQLELNLMNEQRGLYLIDIVDIKNSSLVRRQKVSVL